MKKKIIIGILGIFVVLVIIIFFVSPLWGINVSNLTICKPGSKPDKGFGFISVNKNCYVPGIYDGKICYKKSDCGEEYCVFEVFNSNKGICKNHLDF